MPDPAPAKFSVNISLTNLILIVALSVMGYFVYDTRVNVPTNFATAVDPVGVKLGKQYLPFYLDSYAKAIDSMKVDIAKGKTLEEAQETLSQVAQEERRKAFVEIVGPDLLKIIPAGTKELTPDQKDHVNAFFSGIAKPFRKN